MLLFLHIILYGRILKRAAVTRRRAFTFILCLQFYSFVLLLHFVLFVVARLFVCFLHKTADIALYFAKLVR